MTYPTAPGFQSVEVIDNEVVQTSQAGNLRVQARSLNAQRWEIVASHPPMDRATAAEINAFIKTQRGRSGAFELTLPIYSDARGTASGTVRVNNASGHAAGDTSITIDGLTGTLLKADFITFSSHTKVYMVTEDRSGNGALTIYPPLRRAVADNEVITYDSVAFTVRLNNNMQSFSVGYNALTTKQVGFIEVV